MSKAEEFAYSKYPKEKVGVLYDLARGSIIEGYQQAEKNLELTWEDIEAIDQIFTDVFKDGFNAITDKYYQEVLKRFKDLKNENQEL